MQDSSDFQIFLSIPLFLDPVTTRGISVHRCLISWTFGCPGKLTAKKSVLLVYVAHSWPKQSPAIERLNATAMITRIVTSLDLFRADTIPARFNLQIAKRSGRHSNR
jgi:hypothetical protein